MAHSTKRNGGWSVRWRDPDGTNRRRQVATVRDRDELEREIESAHALGRRWEPHARRNPSVAELCDEYLRDRRRIWAANTYADRDVSLSLWQAWVEARSRRSHVGIEVVSRSLLGEFWDHLRLVRKNAASTANLRVSHVYSWWAWCYDHEEHGAVVPRPRRLAVPEVPRVQVRAPTWAQMDAVLQALVDVERPSLSTSVHGARARVWRAALVMRCTGLRLGQVHRLTWDDLDLEAARMQVRPELGKTRNERVGRYVPLAPVLVEQLAGWGVRSGLLVGSTTTRARSDDERVLRGAWERAGVPEAVWRGRPAHAFRKGFVTGLRLLGADRDAVEHLVGHDLGLAGVYTDTAAYRLNEAVALVPPIGSDNNVRALPAREEG